MLEITFQRTFIQNFQGGHAPTPLGWFASNRHYPDPPPLNPRRAVD